MQLPFLTPSLRNALCGVVAVAGLAACATVPSGPTPGVERSLQQQVDEARRLAEAGRHGEAAARYLELADRAADAPATRIRLRLASAAQWRAAGDAARAERLVDATVIPNGLPALALQRDLLAAELAQVAHGPVDALRLLPGSAADDLPPALRQELHRLRARLLLQSGNPIGSARERLVLATLLEDADQTANQRALLGALRTLGPALPDVQQVDGDLAGWIALARLADGVPLTAERLALDFAAWRERYPDHPATRALIEELVNARRQAAAPDRIALLLPATGPLAVAAVALRDGFIAGRLGTENGPATRVWIYDTSTVEPAGIGSLYDRAVADGAQLVVGPLRKESVVALAGRVPLPVPVLALNRLPPLYTAIGSLFQFALDPEHEATQIADRAWQDGHRQVAMLTPTTDFGRRAATAFRDHFSALGGTVIDERVFESGTNDFTAPITELLQLQASDRRHRELRALLTRKLEHEPRRRQDLDALFVVALPREARQIRPQLNFHHAAEVPVYATSHVFAPGSGAAENRDLEGLLFCDMPWTLLPQPDAVTGAIPAATGGLSRLFALGLDAFALLPYLSRLESEPGARLDGQTGVLTIDAAGRVKRQLLCARFVEGVPSLLGFNPTDVTLWSP